MVNLEIDDAGRKNWLLDHQQQKEGGSRIAIHALTLDRGELHYRDAERDINLEIPQVTQYYRPALTIPEDERPHTYTGAPIRPASIWVPAIAAEPPADAHVLYDFEVLDWGDWVANGSAWGKHPERMLQLADYTAKRCDVEKLRREAAEPKPQSAPIAPEEDDDRPVRPMSCPSSAGCRGTTICLWRRATFAPASSSRPSQAC